MGRCTVLYSTEVRNEQTYGGTVDSTLWSVKVRPSMLSKPGAATSSGAWEEIARKGKKIKPEIFPEFDQ